MRSITRFHFIVGVFATFIVAYALILFNPFHYYFLNDDFIHIPLSKKGELFQRQSFRPIGDLSVQLDYMLWGVKAWGYHLTNLLIHIINTALVFLLAKKLSIKYIVSKNVNFKSLLIALLFFVYAFHSESIFWILGRSASLGSMFFIPSILFYLNRNSSKEHFILSLLFFQLGMLTYESVWIFPFIALSLSILDNKLIKSRFAPEFKWLGIIVFLYGANLWIRFLVINQFAAGYEAEAFLNADIPTLVINFFKLAGRCFVPPFHNSKYFIAGVVLVIIIFLALVIRTKIKLGIASHNREYLTWLIFVLFVSILPYLSLGIDTHGVEGERFLYLSSIFVCIMLVEIIGVFFPGKIFQVIIGGALLLFHLHFLNNAAVYYKTASKISSTTFTQINLLKGKERLFIDSLPQSNNGALIFRSGFQEGVAWLKKSNTVKSVIILSNKIDNQNWNAGYFAKSKYAMGQISNKLEALSNERIINNNVEKFNPATDAWFIYHKSHLEVIK